MKNGSLRKRRCCTRALAAVLACGAAGCLQVKEHLTVRADGSGTVRIEVHSVLTPAATRRTGRWGGYFDRLGDHPPFPPLNAEQVATLFPGQAFTVKTTEGDGRDGKPTVVADVAFTDVNALIASPYGQAHALELRREGDTLRFAARSGFIYAVLVSESQQFRFQSRKYAKQKGEMGCEFTLTLPNGVAASNGEVAEGSATWRLRRADAKDATDEVCLFTQALRATCPAAGVGFEPVSPPRLGLLPFGELREGPVTGMPLPPEPGRVVAAARFEAHALKTVRAFYLPGQEPDRQGFIDPVRRLQSTAAELVGVAIVPQALAPDRWGPGTVEELADNTGADLRLDPQAARGGYTQHTGWDGTFASELAKGSQGEARHVMRIRLRVPGPKAERIVRLRGSIRLDYFTDYRVVKLAGAIPEEWVQGLKKDGRRARGAAHKAIESPKLQELGIELMALRADRRADHSRRGHENTRFWLRLQPTDARVVAIEVFDAHGMAWPRIPWHGSLPSDVDMLHFAVPGPAEPPFSLALLVSTRQVEARMPVALEDLPLVPPEEGGAGPQGKEAR